MFSFLFSWIFLFSWSKACFLTFSLKSFYYYLPPQLIVDCIKHIQQKWHMLPLLKDQKLWNRGSSEELRGPDRLDKSSTSSNNTEDMHLTKFWILYVSYSFVCLIHEINLSLSFKFQQILLSLTSKPEINLATLVEGISLLTPTLQVSYLATLVKNLNQVNCYSNQHYWYTTKATLVKGVSLLTPTLHVNYLAILFKNINQVNYYSYQHYR